MTAAMTGLLHWAGELGNNPAQADRLGIALLQDRPDAQGRNWVSALNNDGSPLQACLTLAPRGHRLRLIGDPTASPDLRYRLARASRALHQSFVLAGAEELVETCRKTLRRLLPDGAAHHELGPGLIWLGADLQRGAAMYVNARWGDAEARWDDAEAWLHSVLPHPSEATALVATIRSHAVLASLAVEGTSAMEGRAKLYWRLKSPFGFASFPLPQMRTETCEMFLARIAGDRDLPLTGVVLSAGFSLASGALRDAKIDLCAHCLPRTPTEWSQDICACSDTIGLVMPDLKEGLERGTCEVAFIGLGVDVEGACRLNVYLKAPSQGG